MECQDSGRVCIGLTMLGSVMSFKWVTDGAIDFDERDDCGAITGGSNGNVEVSAKCVESKL